MMLRFVSLILMFFFFNVNGLAGYLIPHLNLLVIYLPLSPFFLLVQTSFMLSDLLSKLRLKKKKTWFPFASHTILLHILYSIPISHCSVQLQPATLEVL